MDALGGEWLAKRGQPGSGAALLLQSSMTALERINATGMFVHRPGVQRQLTLAR